MKMHEFITTRQGEILARCTAKVRARCSVSVSAAVIDEGLLSSVLDQLVTDLQSGRSSSHAVMSRIDTRPRPDRSRQGVTLSQVAHEYVEVSLTITEVALEESAPIDLREFQWLDQCLDDAIAGLVSEYVGHGESPQAARPMR